MTGLDPARHTIVEIATLITDDNLAVVAEGPDLVVHADAAELAAMDNFVRDMHTRSGLLEAITSSTLGVDIPSGPANAVGGDFFNVSVVIPGVPLW